MKIICHPKNYSYLMTLLRDYIHMELTLVEEGFQYEGLCYYFSMAHLDRLFIDLQKQDDAYLLCFQEERLYKISPHQVYLIEGFSKEAYIYTQDHQYQLHQKLYELEMSLKKYHFVRINKSMLINIDKIDHIIPDVQRRYTIILKNQLQVSLSRHYASDFMKYLKGEAL